MLFEDVTFWMMLCPICPVLTSDILVHLKGCAKTVPLHTTLPANPRYWLGADSKATPVGLCTSQSQVIKSNKRHRHRIATHCHSYLLMELSFTFVFYYSGTLLFFFW